MAGPTCLPFTTAPQCMDFLRTRNSYVTYTYCEIEFVMHYKVLICTYMYIAIAIALCMLYIQGAGSTGTTCPPRYLVDGAKGGTACYLEI